jgi:hypothetical protein
MHLFNMVLLECIGLGYEINTAISSPSEDTFALGQTSTSGLEFRVNSMEFSPIKSFL